MTQQPQWSPLVWALLIATPVLISVGQLMFKIVGTRWTAGQRLSDLVLDPFFLGSMAVYAVATLSWIFVLRTVPLGLAYTFMAVGFVVVPILSSIFFAEEIGWRLVIGLCFIVAGPLTIHA